MTPFDFVKDASLEKKNLMRGTDNDALAEKAYNAYVTNTAFSLHSDTILVANEMNMRHHLPNRPAYEYYINMLRPRKRYASWSKKANNDVLEMVCKTYDCNMKVAHQYLELLTDEQLDELRKQQEKGELKK